MSTSMTPSVGNDTPVMKSASSEARDNAGLATSQAVPCWRRRGTRASRARMISSRGLLMVWARTSMAIGVVTGPGWMALARMHCMTRIPAGTVVAVGSTRTSHLRTSPAKTLLAGGFRAITANARDLQAARDGGGAKAMSSTASTLSLRMQDQQKDELRREFYGRKAGDKGQGDTGAHQHNGRRNRQPRGDDRNHGDHD
jgi:hypothetical protein